jgi:hypothetical protein
MLTALQAKIRGPDRMPVCRQQEASTQLVLSLKSAAPSRAAVERNRKLLEDVAVPQQGLSADRRAGFGSRQLRLPGKYAGVRARECIHFT